MASSTELTTSPDAIAQFTDLLKRSSLIAQTAQDAPVPLLSPISLKSEDINGVTYLVATYSVIPSAAPSLGTSKLGQSEKDWLVAKAPLFTAEPQEPTECINTWELAISNILRAAYAQHTTLHSNNKDKGWFGKAKPAFKQTAGAQGTVAHSGESKGGVTMLGYWDVDEEDREKMSVRVAFDTEADLPTI